MPSIQAIQKSESNGRFINPSKVTVVLGAQWGDEGKGKIVDLLATKADIVCRCQVNFLISLIDSTKWCLYAIHGTGYFPKHD